MSMQLDAGLKNVGTRFLIFPQPRFLPGSDKPEVVTISVPPHEIQPGPADDRMFVVDAVTKPPYSRFFRPPFTGEANAPVQPGRDGHFTHLDPDSREFTCATMYATVRRVLDIWEDYFGHRIAWHFETDFGRLELLPLVEWTNAQSGYGFLEFGYGPTPNGGIDHSRPYCQNFDVLAHELGHSIIFAEVGVPAHPDDQAIDYGGMHEGFADLTALISVLHFDTVVTRLLNNTSGNLFTVNELDRVGELSASREIRVVFNNLRMSDVGVEPHERSLPLTGGIFDIMVEVFQKKLVSMKLISQELAEMSSQGPDRSQDLDKIKTAFEAAYKGHEEEFKVALLEARDYLGRLLATTCGKLTPNFLTYHDILRTLLRADRVVSKGAHQQTIRECFAWREIAPLPSSMLLKPHTLRDCGLLERTRVLDEARALAGNGHHEEKEAHLSAELKENVRSVVEGMMAKMGGKDRPQNRKQ